MGLANEHSLKVQQLGGKFLLEDEFMKRYPGLCVQCGYVVCVCPMVPESTVGRLAKELAIGTISTYFSTLSLKNSLRSAEIASRVLTRVGGLSGLVGQFPLR